MNRYLGVWIRHGVSDVCRFGPVERLSARFIDELAEVLGATGAPCALRAQWIASLGCSLPSDTCRTIVLVKTMDARRAAEEATSVLRNIWEPLVGKRQYPVDPLQIASSLGIDVFQGKLPREMSGALLKEPGRDPVIVLNRDDSNNRQRFSAAHELGHYILRAASDSAQYGYADYRDERSSTGTVDEERFAECIRC